MNSCGSISSKNTYRRVVFVATIAMLLAAHFGGIGRSAAFAAPVTPIITPSGGYFKGSMLVNINCFTPDVTIYYTTNGTTPTTSSPVFTPGNLLTVSSNETVNTMAVASDDTESPVATGIFTIGSTTTVATPTISPDGGSTTGNAIVTIADSTLGTSIYYTTDGSVPTTASNHYTGSFAVSGAPVQVRAIAYAINYADSAIASSTFNTNQSTQAAAPTFGSASGTYNGWVNVTLASTTANAVIRYTLDGTNPTTKSTIYSGAKFINASCTLKACAYHANMADSAVSSAAYTITQTSSTIINVTSAPYNASTSSSDNTQAFQMALTAAENTYNSNPRQVELLIPEGTYNFSNSVGLTVNSINNLTIEGSGSTLIFANAVTPFNCSASDGLTIQDLTIDTSGSPDASGWVTAINGSTSFDMLMDPSFTLASGATYTAALQYDPDRLTPARNGIDSFQTYAVSSVLSGSNSSVCKVRFNNPYTAITTGMYVDMRSFSNNAFVFWILDTVAVKNVRVYSDYCFGANIYRCENVSLNSFTVLRNPAKSRLLSSEADAVHFTTCKGQMTMEDCDFENQGDDGTNFAGAYYTIYSVAGNSISVFNSNNTSSSPSIAQGEEMEFRTGDTMLQTGTGMVTAVTTTAKNGSVPALTNLTFDTVPSGLRTNLDCVDSLTWIARGLVDRCNYIGNRARGILVQNPNVTVQNSHFQDISGSAIHVSTVQNPWEEGTGTSFVTLRNNYIENCDYGQAGVAAGAIYVYAQNQSKTTGSAGTHKNVVIEDNTIRNTDNSDIVVTAADNVDVVNNSIENCVNSQNTNVALTGYAIAAQNATNIRINYNTQTETNYLRFAYDHWMISGPSGGYNVEPFVIGFSQTAQHKIQWTYSWNVQDALPTGQTVFVHICDSNGNVVTQSPNGGLADPSTWTNGTRTISNVIATDLTSVPDGTYTVRIGLYSQSSGARLKLAGDDDGTQRIICGTLTLSGSGSTITFLTQRADVRPSVASFQQTGPRQFTISYSWDVHDTIPSGYVTFAHICNSTGTIIQGISSGTTTLPPNQWPVGSKQVSSVVTINLVSQGTMPDGTYTINVGVYNPNVQGNQRLALMGDPDTQTRIITGQFATLTGADKSIWNDPNTTSGVTLEGNTGF